MCKEEPIRPKLPAANILYDNVVQSSVTPIKENILRCRYLKIMRAVKTNKQQLSPVCQTFAPVWR